MTFGEPFLNLFKNLPDLLLYFCLGISASLENILPPIPGDTITAFGAFLVGIGRLNFFMVYMVTTLGSLLGFLTLFWIGRYLGRRFFIVKDFRFFKKKDIYRAEAWFARHGYLIIALNRFLPGLRSVISVVAGVSQLNPYKVTLLALLSGSLWNMLWMLMGYSLGNNWEKVTERISEIMMKYNLAVVLLFIVVVSFLFFRKKR